MADGEGLSGHTSPCSGKVCVAAMADGAGPSQTQQIGKLPLWRLRQGHPVGVLATPCGGVAAATCGRSVDRTSRPALHEAGSNFAQSYPAARFGAVCAPGPVRCRDRPRPVTRVLAARHG